MPISNVVGDAIAAPGPRGQGEGEVQAVFEVPTVSDAMGLIHEHPTDIGPGGELVDVLVVGGVDATGVTLPLVVQDTLYEIQGLIEAVPFVESDDGSDLFSREGKLFAHAILFDHDEAGPFGHFEVNPREP